MPFNFFFYQVFYSPPVIEKYVHLIMVNTKRTDALWDSKLKSISQHVFDVRFIYLKKFIFYYIYDRYTLNVLWLPRSIKN